MKPSPKKQDILDAIEHAEGCVQEKFSPNEFKLRYYGFLPPFFLRKYDDIDSWLEFDKEDKNLSTENKMELLRDFRGSKWAKMAYSWLENGIPPVILISIPMSEKELIPMVGDGRGRISFAVLFNKKVPVYHLIYKL